ncbi:MAG: hydroxymethylglutaryl-CoA lyase [Planctomycetota bacterium]
MADNAANRCRITDVAPRDGLQNEDARVPTEDKFELVHRLADAGVDEVEVTSFVSQHWVPQLGDARHLFDMLQHEKHATVVFSALVPNDKGMTNALSVNERAGFRLLDKVSVFTAATESFTKRNVNATVDETFERFEPVVRRARDAGLAVRGYLSCVVECPYEGAVSPERVASLAGRLTDLGVDEVDLGDTIGRATPESVESMLLAVFDRVPADRLVLHLHDTFGNAAAVARRAIDLGLRSFDASAAGLGGCPFASTPGHPAPGNIDTRALLDTVEAAGLEHGVDRSMLAAAADFAHEALRRARAEDGPPA